MKACYPGTFDPITKGHLDIIERAAKLFDELVILIMKNPRKHCTFSEEERKAMIETSLKECKLKKVKVEIGSGLTVEYANKIEARALIRGIRAVSDYEYELQQATANLMLNDEIETVFLIAKPEYSFLSSTTVKEIAANGGEISKFIPHSIMDEVKKKLNS